MLKLYKIDYISLELIGYTSIAGAILLYVSDKAKKFKLKIKNKSTKFILAGLFQCLAFLPGFSRAGSCIIAFRIFGEDRKYSSIYSLYMGIPIICLSFFSNINEFENFIVDKNLSLIFITTLDVDSLTEIIIFPLPLIASTAFLTRFSITHANKVGPIGIMISFWDILSSNSVFAGNLDFR